MSRFLRKAVFIAIICTLIFALAQTAAARTTPEVFITTEGVNLRNSPSTTGNILTVVSSGSNVTLLNHDPAGWSRVRVNSFEGFIRSDFLTFPPNRAPMTFRTTEGVNVRAAANTTSAVLRVVNTGTDVEVFTHDPAGWSSVRVNGTTGFIRSDFLMFPIAGAQQQTTGPATEQSVRVLHTVGGVNFRAAPSTDAGIIRVLNAGTRVEVLSSNNGWSNVRVNGNTGYISSDLLGAAPARNVELLTMEQVRPLLRYNTDIAITDVRTGRTFNIRIFSMGRHADFDTSTREDTNIKHSIRDGRWSWAARPVWVHLGDRTIAASVNGMPHGGSAIANNGVSGHFCLHFYGTITNNQRYQADLRSAIAEAYNAAR